MENETRSPPKNDMLSQSYCEGIERVVGATVNSVFNFQVPSNIIEDRKKYWNSFFEKYSEEISDEIDLDVDTLQPSPEPVPEPYVEEVAEEYSPLRIPMRKPLSLVQHWVDTGNLLHKDLLGNYKSPVTRPFVNKQDLLKRSVSARKIQRSNRHNWKANSGSSSSSSVDTAAYILSNANKTKKADATAIVEGSKLQKDMGAEQTKSAAICPPVGSDGGSEHISNGISQDNLVRTLSQPLLENPISDTVLKSHHTIGNLAETNMLHNTILTPDSIGPENNNVQFPNQNITLMESIEKALMCLTSNSVMTPSHSDRGSIESSSSHEEEASITESQILSGGNETSKIHRKKLYSGRDSPVDLINIRSSIGNRLSQAKEALHPALDPVTSAVKISYLKKRKLQATKRRQKWTSLFAKTSMNSTNQVDGLEDNGLVSETSEEPHNTTMKDTTQTKIRPSRKVIARKIRKFTPKRTPFRRKVPASALQDSVVHLERLPKTIVKNYNSFKTLLSPQTNPVVNLTRLSDSYIQKYTSHKRIESLKSLASVENQQRRRKKAIKKKSAKMLPPDTQYIDSDETGSSHSIIFFKCLDNENIKGSATSDSSSLMDNSSQDLLCKLANPIPITKSLEQVDGKYSTPIASNNSFERLRQKSKQHNTRSASPQKVKKLSRSGKFEIIRREEIQNPVVVLQRLPKEVLRIHDERLEESCLSQETPKKIGKSILTELDDSVDKEHHNLRSQSQNKSTKNKKSSDRLVFTTTLGHENFSDYSDHSELSTTSNRSRTLKNNTSLISSKRNRAPLLTITSDEEDDLESLIQLLPRKRAKSRSGREKEQDNNLNDTATKLVHTMVILSDTTDDIDTVKKNKRKVLQSRPSITQKSVVRIADSTTQEEDGKLVRRSKRTKKIEQRNIRNGVRKSKRLETHDTQIHHEEDNTNKRSDGFICTEPDVNHVTSTCSDERVSSTESESRLLGRTSDTAREDVVNMKGQTGEITKAITPNNTKKYSVNVKCKETKVHCLRFQTRLFEESDSECLSSSSYPLSAA